VAITGALVVNTFEAARDAALAGIGAAQLPIPIVLDDLRTGALVLLAGPTGRIAFTALWPARRLPLRVRLYLEAVARHAERLAIAVQHALAVPRAAGPARRTRT
jgi:DNA-binding transcriptional LysR family regulator